MTTEPIRNQTKSTDIDPNRMPWEPCQDKKNTIWGLSLSWAAEFNPYIICRSTRQEKNKTDLLITCFAITHIRCHGLLN